VGLCIATNFLFFVSIRNFPEIEILSPTFICSIGLFIIHNYFAFTHFGSQYHPFSEVLCYMTLFCWLIPIVLLCSCSANDNVLPTHSNSNIDNSSKIILNNNCSNCYLNPFYLLFLIEKNEDLVSNYFKGKSNRKYGLLSFMRYIQDNYLPNRRTTRKLY